MNSLGEIARQELVGVLLLRDGFFEQHEARIGRDRHFAYAPHRWRRLRGDGVVFIHAQFTGCAHADGHAENTRQAFFIQRMRNDRAAVASKLQFVERDRSRQTYCAAARQIARRQRSVEKARADCKIDAP